ncbi:uncharacterized protein LOC127770389 isoform X1 [Oryza glaberrima]|uniref:uncharacterized protein LOC127770389 isoform X1 n=1 Tax=Oryza glaberrima TaxID=4538 RepID=UPI00224C2B2E|nr:uncharacterized protein LOC127770389 isoform X1 [Oryza glaberrima]
MDPGGMLLEDFGQRVDLTRRIREVLANYPEGTTALRELIQNADDAGASRVRLCLDRRAHGAGSLLAPALAQWQGPALLAYNDAVFTDEDFASISRIGDSRKVSQVWKTGRFGVGFNSVYHLTDLPSFVSGKYIVLFDPQGAYLPNVSAANPGKRIDFVSSSAITLYNDQLSPYRAFGCDMKAPFQGTLFRFPLRTAEQASLSRLSRQVYTEDDILSLFAQLYEEAVYNLLFLKNVLSLEMYVWESGMSEPKIVYSCSIGSQHDNLRWHRQALVRFSGTAAESSEQKIDSFSMDFVSKSFLGEKFEKKSYTYFIVQGMASALSEIGIFATTAAKDYDLHLLPWASVAACISNVGPEEVILRQGRAFCFLPLPVKTGLSVHVNGYFEVSSNRRDIWYGADMDRGGKLRSDWNMLLLEDVVAPLFRELLLQLRTVLDSKISYYSLWPTGLYEEPWSILVEQICKFIYTSPVFHSEIKGGTWITPAESLLHDEGFSRSDDLSEALVMLGMPVVRLPGAIADMFPKFHSKYMLKIVTPATVRHFLKDFENLGTLEKSQKLILLEYCLADLDSGNIGKCMNGLPLIPLANKQFGIFSGISQENQYYVCDSIEYELLSAVSDRIIDRSIPPVILDKLYQIASSSQVNISLIEGRTFLQFFPWLFPPGWKCRNQVPWDPESGGSSPTAAWFKLFWQYIGDCSYDLDLFSDWPILPSTSGHLYRASTVSKLINTGSLSNLMKELLTKLGCKILDTKYLSTCQHLSNYVYDGDASGVLHSIFGVASLEGVDLQALFQRITPAEKNELYQFVLDAKWYLGPHLSDMSINLCKKLPIFRVFDGGSPSSYGFSDLSTSRKYLPPLGVAEQLLNDDFVFCISPSDEDIIMRYYGIERMPKSNFYQRYVLNRLDELQTEFRDSVLVTILQDLPQLSLENPRFKEALKVLRFVPTTNGVLKSPQSLYDPRVEELYALLQESDCFPHGLFQNPEVLDMLLCLGLRTSVSIDTIIQSARHIDSLVHKDHHKAHSRGKVLLSYLEVHAHKWYVHKPFDGRKKVNMLAKVTTVLRSRDTSWEADLEKFWSDLRMICWCPVLVTAPSPALPWPSVSSMVAPPKQVRMQDDMWIVSASSRILDGECTSSALSYSLGWLSPPSGSVIAAQLLELGKNNEIVTDQVLRQELASVMPKIYSLLSNLIGSDEMDIVKVVLEGCRWIWVGDGFAKTDEVVLTGHLHLAPYIRVIPIDLAVFKDLFLELGIKEQLDPVDYASILTRMATRKASTSLQAEELRTAVLVVQHLAEFRFQDHQTQIYLPDSSARLCLSSELVFNDAPWLLDFDEDITGNAPSIAFNSKKYVHNFVHGNISNDVAERLGVRSLRRLLLAESSDSMNLSLSGVAEAFGQHEDLTTRLKHIVEMYADGPGILFELVQNAEDAKASEVVFLLDKTHYGTSSILSPEMAEWQGPALYCFNDSIFSPQDLYAISRIGQDSKLEKPFAIGRFGLGFNCVYHFTDIPGFVSGENIVMFDPHASYLPGISPSHPGLRIKFVGRRILEQFPDQFTPFLHFGCNLQQPFPGTLFRFPLRNEAAASRSQIKREQYTPQDVEMLFSSFSEVVSEALLFLRNVKNITLYVKESDSQEMKLVHRVSKHNSYEMAKEPHALNTMLAFINGNQPSGMDRNQFFNKLNKTKDSDLPWSSQKVSIFEQSPAACLVHSWILTESIGGGHARKLSTASGSKSHLFVPWASVAAYLHSVTVDNTKELSGEAEVNLDDLVLKQLSLGSSKDRKFFEGRAFCFLPLPINTSMPVHVNAYFELSSNRRDIWIGNDMAGGGRVRSEWNLALLEDVAAPAYGHLLAAIAQELGPSDLFLSFWPTAVGVEPWSSMVRKLYVSIAELGLHVLYTKARGGHWVSTRQAIFPDFSFSKAIELAEVLSEAGLPVVSVSKPIVDSFLNAYPSVHLLNPHLLRNLLIRRKRGFRNREEAILVLEYCLSDMGDPSFPDKLQGLALLPLANGSFTTFTNRGEGERVFFSSQMEFELLKDSIPHLVVDNSLPDAILKKLYDIACSARSNIYLFTCNFLLELLPRILPPEWQHAKQLFWSPGHQGQPSVEWMVSLWNFLRHSCEDLSIFAKWPILPLVDGKLMQLGNASNVIIDDGWSENMYSLLQKLGCFFLRSDLQIEHPQLANFVQEATAVGVLNAVQSVASNFQDIKELFMGISLAETHELRSFIFQSKWFSGNHMNSSHMNTIRNLPIFESYKSRELVSLTSPRKWLKPEGVHEDLLNESFIRTESAKEKSILVSYFAIREPQKAEFYKDHVLPRISEFLSQPAVVSAILRDVKLLAENDTSVRAALHETPFVLAASGAWVHPTRLYDPRVPELHKLLHKETFFPSEKFMTTEVIELLASFGLKSKLGFSTLLDIARSVSLQQDDALEHGKRLLTYLNFLEFKASNMEDKKTFHGDDNQEASKTDGSFEAENDGDGYDPEETILSLFSNFDHDLPEDEFWSELKNISWCPVHVAPLLKGLPWFISEDHVAPPITTRPKSQMWLVSSKMRILSADSCSMYLQRKLGWLDPPNANILSSQLVEISKSYDELKMFSEDSTNDAVPQKEIQLIYSKLQDIIDTADTNILKRNLDGHPWVYIGDRFVPPQALAFDSPVKYHPYLYAVPSELSEYKRLLSVLGVKQTFDAADYLNVLQCLQSDAKGEPLSTEQLSFVHRVLEAFVDCYPDNQAPDMMVNSLLIPDSFGVLTPARNLVYNDAPWMNADPTSKSFVHLSIGNDLANRLGVRSLRGASLLDDELMTDLPCMEYAKISELLALYGESDFLLFDLIELADHCNAKKVHLIYDKRDHPKQSLLQQSLGDFQGSSLTVVFEGTIMSREEVCSLQLPPPWKLKGNILNYGLGLLSSYFVCDTLSILSGGYFYIFDPLGLTGGTTSTATSSARFFSLIGNDLVERFHDQFTPMRVTQEASLSSAISTVIRMPLSSKCLKELEAGCNRVKHIFDRFTQNPSSTLLFLRSIIQVSLSTWEGGASQPTLNYSVLVDPSVATLRNPFSEKKWRKFQLSRIFASTSAAIKMQAIDVHVIDNGCNYIDKWFVALCLGSGQTRNMALDRRYLAYNLTPVAGVAAHIARNGVSTNIHASSCILSPLPLSGSISMPVTTLGHFIVRHNGGRYIFGSSHDKSLSDLEMHKNKLVEAWNKELMLCVRDSYVEMVLEFQKLRKDPLSSAIESRSAHSVSTILQAYGDRVYSFWPRSKQHPASLTGYGSTVTNVNSPRASKADWQSLVEQVIRPFYVRLADLPVWQLYGGNLVKVDEGMFLSHSGSGDDDNLPSASVCSFIKEHYPVFSVPWELVREIQAVEVNVREIRPKMVRDLLKASSSILLRSIETYMDVLEYCFSDMDPYRFSDLHIHEESRVSNQQSEIMNSSISNSMPSSSSSVSYHRNTQRQGASGGDALEIVTYFGKALYDFGRGVVEDISKTGGSASHRTQAAENNVLSSIITELKGVPFPTSTKCLTRLGSTELWIAREEQQLLMRPFLHHFIHHQCLQKPFLELLLTTQVIHRPLKLRSFSPHLLSGHLKHIFDERWVHLAVEKKSPWIPWDNNANSSTAGPSPEWIRLFWKIFSSMSGDLSLLSDWPLIPAYLDRPVLCRVKECHLIFVPPADDSNPDSGDSAARVVDTSAHPGDETGEAEQNSILDTAFQSMNSAFPWLPALLYKLNIPVFDLSFPECGTICNLFPSRDRTLGQIIASKLVAIKNGGHLPLPLSLSSEDCDKLFALFVSEFRLSSNHLYQREELDVLRELPMYKTVIGTYTSLSGSDHCILSPTAFFHPADSRCLSSTANADLFLQALGVEQLSDQEILVRFALPGFGNKSAQEQEDILAYLYSNWKDLQLNSSVVNTLKETNFLTSANEFCTELFKPRELLDPSDALLTSVFSGERHKFPAERFLSDGWLVILRKAGLRTSTEADMIVQCATKIESMGNDIVSSSEDPSDFEADFSGSKNEIPFELWSLAESVVNVILANFATLYDSSFCEKIGKIAFIPAEKGFPSIGGKRGGRRVLASYSESILSKDWPLAWSSAPILTNQAIIPPEYSWGAFRLRSPPAFTTVLKHLQSVGRGNGEDTLAHWPTSSGIMTVEDAFLRILQYLDKIWGTISSSEKNELQTLAFIPVANGTRLVTVKSLFARLTINMSPFAFELPSLYLPFVTILREIGMQETLTNTYARELLLDIQKACGYQRLNPNELRAVMEILDFMCSGVNQATDGSEDIFDSVIPDDGCRLVSAVSCVYIDPYGSHLLSNIDTSRIRFAHPDLPQNICNTLGIKKLSDVIVEELDGKEELKMVNSICSVTLDKIKEKLLSKLLQDALRIVMIGVSNHFPSFEALNLAQIESVLKDISQNLQFVQRLHTRFLLLPMLQDVTRSSQRPPFPEWSSNGKHRSVCFVNKSTGQILVAEPPNFLTIHDAIAIVVSYRLGAPVILPIASVFACPDGTEKEVLKILRLGTDIGVSKREGRYNGSLGAELLSQDARQVQFLPLRPFYSGEIVAWKTGKEGEKLRYGRVPEDVRPSAGQALYRFPVETSAGETCMLLSSQVYSFKSVSMADLSSAPLQLDSGRVAGGQQGFSPINTGTEAADDVATGLEYGKVSSTELVQAVHDMLSAAGVRMDATKETLLQTTLSLQDQLKESQVALLVEQEKAEAAVREADVAKSAWSCRVCLNAEVNMTIIPCGHVLCNRCSSSVSRCPFCRTQVSRMMKIFRP